MFKWWRQRKPPISCSACVSVCICSQPVVLVHLCSSSATQVIIMCSSHPGQVWLGLRRGCADCNGISETKSVVYTTHLHGFWFCKHFQNLNQIYGCIHEYFDWNTRIFSFLWDYFHPSDYGFVIYILVEIFFLYVRVIGICILGIVLILTNGHFQALIKPPVVITRFFSSL